MKKYLGVPFLLVAFLILVGTANATTMYTDRASWETAVGAYVETTDYPGSTLSAGTPFDVGFGTMLSFNVDLTVVSIGSGWATWSGGYAGEVLTNYGDTNAYTGTLSPGLTAFGFEAEPNVFDLFDITLDLADGSVLTQSVEGSSGAEFFGFDSGIAISSFTITADVDANGLAIGRFVAAGAPVPEPSTMLLLGVGLIGLAGATRRKLKK